MGTEFCPISVPHPSARAGWEAAGGVLAFSPQGEMHMCLRYKVLLLVQREASREGRMVPLHSCYLLAREKGRARQLEADF